MKITIHEEKNSHFTFHGEKKGRSRVTKIPFTTLYQRRRNGAKKTHKFSSRRFNTLFESRSGHISISPDTVYKLARLITQYRDIFSNISEGAVFLLQGVTENDPRLSRLQAYEIGYGCSRIIRGVDDGLVGDGLIACGCGMIDSDSDVVDGLVD